MLQKTITVWITTSECQDRYRNMCQVAMDNVLQTDMIAHADAPVFRVESRAMDVCIWSHLIGELA